MLRVRLLDLGLAVILPLGAGAFAQTEGGMKDPLPPPTAAAQPEQAAAPAEPTQCPDNMDAYAGSDETLTCICPAELTGTGAVWGTDAYTADSATCRAALHAGATGQRGGTVTLRMLPGRPRYPGTTRNGVQSTNYGSYGASYRFEGLPQAAATAAPAAPPSAETPTQCPDNLSAYEGSDERLACVCSPERMGAGAVWGTDTYTADSATCRAALHAGAAGRRGGAVSVAMLPGQARYPGTTRNGVQSMNYENYGASFRFEPGPAGTAGASPQAPGQGQGQAQCPDNLSAYEGSDETITCICPPALTGSGTVWGTDTYTADSATCRSAVHAGALTARGGSVSVEMLPGEARYPGTTRNGVQSMNYGNYRASFRFRRAEGAAPRATAAASSAPVQCPDNLTAYENSDEALTCICPGELTVRGTIWGSDLYTADSATCRAAVHAGVIGLSGGTVTARMAPGAARYPGSTRNGVQSMNFGAYGASFRFQGGQRAKDAAPVQARVAESLQRSGQVQLYVTFRTGSADLDIGAAPVLGEVRDALLADPSLRLRLVGHTDTTGSAAVNQPLSVRRAEAVRAWLAANGVAADRLGAEGRGPSEPIADNGTEAGRALNRRVQAMRVQ